MFSISRAAQLPLWAITCLQCFPVAAVAQAQGIPRAAPSAASARLDPADAKAPVPAVVYLSPLRAYQGFADAPVGSWRDANALVYQRGGWRAYARETALPAAAPPAVPGASQPAPAAKPADGGHAGHKMP